MLLFHCSSVFIVMYSSSCTVILWFCTPVLYTIVDISFHCNSGLQLCTALVVLKYIIGVSFTVIYSMVGMTVSL